MRARLLKHGRQDVAAVDRRLPRSLRLQQGTLQDALKGCRRLRRRLRRPRQGQEVLRHERLQLLPEFTDVTAAVVNHVTAGRVL